MKGYPISADELMVWVAAHRNTSDGTKRFSINQIFLIQIKEISENALAKIPISQAS